MTDREKQLTSEILDKVRELAALRFAEPRKFEPGVTTIGYAGRVYDAEEMVSLVDSSLEFWLTAGRYALRFETRLANMYGMRSASLVNSGSSANLVAFSAITSHTWGDRRVKAGDEVITVAAGFPTTVFPMLQFGAVPVFVDVTLPTYNIDVTKLEEALSPRTRAVMVAHTLGNPFDLDAVTDFCKKHDLWLIEDNCDANGSRYRGRRTGSFGDLSTLSFYPPHHMTMGEGGAVLSNSPAMTRVLNSFRDWGRDCWCDPGKDNTCGKRFAWQLGELPPSYDHKYTFTHLGYNLKVTDMQAAVGVAQLDKLESFGGARRDNWNFYRQTLADLDDVFILPEPTPHSDPSWFGFLMTVRDGAPFTRDQIVQHLESKKIQTRMLFAGNLVRQPAITQWIVDRPGAYRIAGELPNTDRVMNRSFWIGVYPGLTAPMREYVADAIRTFVKGVL
ncbi:MAG TPA: lipopolysaccharide biosynthesis protein RfbH [Thermoanaerobaculia bacterium]|nr:lipopolysaccharide biosynthesis protein RfbH [Thermoanaerobaculia bacterium]